MDFSYLKETLDRSNNYMSLALALTEQVLDLIRYSDMDAYDKYKAVNELIRYHEKYPCHHSAEWVANWRKEFDGILVDSNTLALDMEDLPY